MQNLTSIIDIFYPPFRRLMPLQTFRYAACGGANTVLGLAIYFVLLNYGFHRENFDAGFFVFKPENASLFICSTVTLFIGFLLNKYIVFTSSYLRGRVQFFRYFVSFATNLGLNYLLLNFFTQVLRTDKFLAQVIAISIVIVLSYFTQKHFSFKTKAEDKSHSH